MDDIPPILILTAVRLEAMAIARALKLPPRARRHARSESFAQNDRVQLRLVGIGAENLPALLPQGLRAVIMAGVAGGLAPELKIGDVVVDALSTPMPGIPALAGPIHSALQVVTHPQDKANLYSQTGALAVEMESARVRAWAALHHIAYCGVRGISDAAGDVLPPALLTLVDDMGEIRTRAVMKLLLTEPGQIPALMQLGKNAKLAAAAAAQTVKAILETGWPESNQ